MEIIHRTDDAMADDDKTLPMRNRIDMSLKKRAIAMSDQLHFDFAWYERFDAKPLEHDRQEVFHFGAYFTFEVAKTKLFRHSTRVVDPVAFPLHNVGVLEAIFI